MASDKHTGRPIRYRARNREGARRIEWWVYRRPQADNTIVRGRKIFFEPGLLLIGINRVDIRREIP